MAATILVADDSATMRMIVQATLTGAGWKVVTAGNGQEALEMARSHPIDLVVSDWNMPVMGGLELIQGLRGEDQYVDVRSRADHGRRRGQQDGRPDLGCAAGCPSRSIPTCWWNWRPNCSMSSRARRRFIYEGVPAMSSGLDLSQFYETFFDEADELLAQMEQLLLEAGWAHDIEQLNAIFRAAHSIKGGAATFGCFTQLAGTTHLLENLLDAIRRGEMALRTDMVDIFLETKDVLKSQLDAYRASEARRSRIRAHLRGTEATGPGA